MTQRASMVSGHARKKGDSGWTIRPFYSLLFVKLVLASQALRFETLTLERDLRQRQSSTSGDSMDWGSYVELQHRLRMLLVAHK